MEDQRTVDLAVIAELEALDDGGGESLLSQLIALFFDLSPKAIVQISHAQKQADADSMRAAAHGLKSSAGNLGARKMSSLCESIEKLGRAGQTTQASALVAELEAEFAQVKSELERIRQSARKAA